MKYNEERYGIHVRTVDLCDAEFIYQLRSDKTLTKYLSPVEGSVEDQIKWIRNYKNRESEGKELYFLFSYKNEKQGLARIYNIEDNHFMQGSWLFRPGAPAGCSLLGNIISSEIGFEQPGMEYELTEAKRANNTHKWVKTFNPEIIRETEEDIYYRISKENFEKAKVKHIELCKKVMAL